MNQEINAHMVCSLLSHREDPCYEGPKWAQVSEPETWSMHPKPEKNARSGPWLFLVRPIVLVIFSFCVEFWIRVLGFQCFRFGAQICAVHAACGIDRSTALLQQGNCCSAAA